PEGRGVVHEPGASARLGSIRRCCRVVRRGLSASSGHSARGSMGASLLRHAREVRAPARSKSRNTAIVFRVPIEVQTVAGPPRGFRTRVVASRSLTPTTRAIELEKPQAFTFRPTQFPFLQLKTAEGHDTRPMSLARSATRPRLDYAVRISTSP